MPLDFRWLREYSNLIYLGLLFPSSIAVGVALGYLVDRWLGTDPWAKLAGFLFGVLAGGLNFYRDYKKYVQKDDSTRKG